MWRPAVSRAAGSGDPRRTGSGDPRRTSGDPRRTLRNSMDPFHFACPHCTSPLRVREKLLVGRQVECPECGQALVIVERAGKLLAEAAAQKISPVAPGRRQVEAGLRQAVAGLLPEPPSFENHKHQTFFQPPPWPAPPPAPPLLPPPPPPFPP